METDVAVALTDSYDKELVYRQLQYLLAELGGAKALIPPGKKVLVKPNLLAKVRPVEAVTTHPAVMEAVCRLVQDCGSQPVIAESPAGAYTPQVLRSIYQICGMEEVSRACGVPLIRETAFQTVRVNGGVVQEMPVIQAALDCDLIISVGKVKTHALTGFTGATKNLFGIVPGFHKAQFHAKYPKDAFAQSILDVCAFASPVLSILDGVWGMEGDGPSAGHPKKVGVLLASRNSHALDLAASTLVGLDPASLPLTQLALSQELCPKLSDITWKGDPVQPPLTVFTPARDGVPRLIRQLPSPIRRFYTKHFTPYPVFTSACVGCGHCAEICPAKAITITDKQAVIARKLCIRCYCCQETCPFHAVNLKTGK